ncbi:ATP-binding protein [Steroidobacter flavus]|uniref:histidine kinase n=1 Tax=Steroidobacter flavus TaxID=1842136 RepID=A0ABV8SPE5_9GAMM
MAVRPGPPLALMPFARAIAALCVAIGIIALIGWWLSFPLLHNLVPGLGTLKPNTALCFVLGGLSLAGLAAHSRPKGAFSRLLIRIQPTAAALLLLVASTTLLSYAMHAPIGIDRLLVPHDPPNQLSLFPWRMSPISALSFSLLAVTMLPWPARLTRLWLAMEVIVLLISVSAFIMVLGYAYEAASLYSLPGFSVVALHTALGLLVLTKAVLTVHPRFVLAGQIMAPDQAGAETRRLLPAAILLPCIVGWLLLQGQRRGYYDAELGLAMLTAVNMLVFSTLIWWNSHIVRRSDVALLAHLRRVEAVAELDRAILSMRSTREIAGKALDHLRRMVPCAGASVIVFDRNSSAHRLLAAGTCGATNFIPRVHSVASYEEALRDVGSGQAILLGDLNAVESNTELFNELRHAGVVSYVGLPLRGEQHLLGMLELIDARPHCFNKEHVQAAHSIADQLAIALQQALLREDIERHTASLERRVAERTRELQAMNQELTFANRDLEEFTASAAHDLRAPLNGMSGHCGLLQAIIEQHPEEEARRHMERIEASVRRMNDVIDGMLGLAQLTKVELTRRPVDLNLVATEVIQELQQQYPDHRVRFNIDCGAPICADPRLMRSLLVNLLGNAWKYTTRTDFPSVSLARQEDMGGPMFVVRDNGVGFDMNFAQHLFEPFRRMHTLSEFPGVGIGLATAARIVQRYGGRIWADSRVGEGSSFYFTLPQAAATNDEPVTTD